MTTPAKNTVVKQLFFFPTTSHIAPDTSSDGCQNFAWIVAANEAVVFNFHAKRYTSTAGGNYYDVVVYELYPDGTIGNVSNWPNRLAGTPLSFGPTYTTTTATVSYYRVLVFTITNVVGALEVEVWTS